MQNTIIRTNYTLEQDEQESYERRVYLLMSRFLHEKRRLNTSDKIKALRLRQGKES